MIIGKPFEGRVEFGRYASGETAMLVRGHDGVPVAKATVCLDGAGAPAPGADQVWVKTWSENEGMDEALTAAGIATPVAAFMLPNQCRAVLMQLTPDALLALQAAQGSNAETRPPPFLRVGRTHAPRPVVELYAWIVTEENGGEGVAACEMELEGRTFMMPLVGADEARIRSLESHARVVEQTAGLPVQLRRFVIDEGYGA